MNQWNRKAELAVQKQQDDMARAALQRSLSQQQLATGFAQQLEDQTAETETLRSAFANLQQKLHETGAACEMLIAQNRRARTVGKAHAARASCHSRQGCDTRSSAREDPANEATMLRATSFLKRRRWRTGFRRSRREDQIERLLEDLKSRQPRLA